MHRVDLEVGLPVVVGALPVARPQHLAAVLGVPVVGGRALDRLVAARGQQREAGRVVRRPGGGDADTLGVRVEAQLLGDDEAGVAVAHAPLARAHGDRRVALGQLQRAEALVQRQAHVLGCHVLAVADDLLAHRLRRLRRHGARGRAASGRRSDHAHPVGQRIGDVAALLAVVADAAAALRDERGLADAAARHQQQVACQGAVLAVTCDDHAGHGLRALRLPRLEARQVLDAGALKQAAVAVAARVGHGHHIEAAVGQVERRLDALVARGDNDRLLARHQPELVDQAAGAAGQHHAGQVVVAEHERLLDRPGRDHQLGRAEAVHGAALVDRHQQPLVDAAGVGRLVGSRRRTRPRARPGRSGGRGRAGRPGQVAAQREPSSTSATCLPCSAASAAASRPDSPPPITEHVDVPVHLVVALGTAVAGIDLAQAGGVPQDLLVQRPRPARVDEGLVVEADLHAEARRHPADEVQEVALAATARR